jgi:hypothetical protein
MEYFACNQYVRKLILILFDDKGNERYFYGISKNKLMSAKSVFHSKFFDLENPIDLKVLNKLETFARVRGRKFCRREVSVCW